MAHTGFPRVLRQLYVSKKKKTDPMIFLDVAFPIRCRWQIQVNKKQKSSLVYIWSGVFDNKIKLYILSPDQNQTSFDNLLK